MTRLEYGIFISAGILRSGLISAFSENNFPPSSARLCSFGSVKCTHTNHPNHLFFVATTATLKWIDFFPRCCCFDCDQLGRWWENSIFFACYGKTKKIINCYCCNCVDMTPDISNILGNIYCLICIYKLTLFKCQLYVYTVLMFFGLNVLFYKIYFILKCKLLRILSKSSFVIRDLMKNSRGSISKTSSLPTNLMEE